MIVYQGSPQITEGGLNKISVSNDELEDLNVQILEQLKIMNLHMSFATDENITSEEI